MRIYECSQQPLKDTKSLITTPKKFYDHPYHPNIGSTPQGTFSRYALQVTQLKVSVIKHRCLFSFHTQLILLPSGLRAEGTAAVVDFYTMISTYMLLFLHTNGITETALRISELWKFEQVIFHF